MVNSQVRAHKSDAGFLYNLKMAGISEEDLLLPDSQSQLLTIPAGGRRDALAGLLHGEASARNSVLSIDLDSMNIPRKSGRFVPLSGGAAVQRMILQRNRFRALCGDHVPDNLRLPRGAQGAGLRRIVAAVILFFEWQKVVTAINELIQKKLAEFQNRQPERLVIRIVSSLGGGTGSALIVPLAMLLRDRVSMIAPDTKVHIELHAVSGMVFFTKLRTDMERRRCLANSATTLREMLFAQLAANRQPLSVVLGMNPPRDNAEKLFDEVVFYGETNSGSGYQTEETLNSIISTNLLAASNKALELAVSNAANTESCQDRRNHDVFGTRLSLVARVPLPGIASAQAWLAQELDLQCLLETGAESREMSRTNRNRVLSDLEFAKIIQQITQTLRKRFNEGTDREEFRNAADRDAASLQREFEKRLQFFRDAATVALDQEVERMRSTFVEQTEQHAARVIDVARSLANGLPSCRGLIAVLSAALEEEFARVSERLRELREQDSEKALRHRFDEWRREPSGTLWGRRSGLRNVCLEGWKHLVELTLERLALELFRDHWLAPVARMLQEEQDCITERETELEIRRLGVQREASLAQQEIPLDNGFFTTIITAKDVLPLLHKLSIALSKKYAGQPAVLSLSDVLDTPRDELKSVLMRGWTENLQRVQKFFADDLKDLNGFLEFYPDTGFNVARWLAASAQQPLPACLGIYDREPGNSPVDGLVVGPECFHETWRQVEYAIKPDIPMNWKKSNERFELVVQLARTAVPVAALPGLDDMIQAEHEIEQSTPPADDPAWPILWSHGLLKDARRTPLTPEEEAGLVAISDTDNSAKRDDVPPA